MIPTRVGRILRTLRHLRLRQITAQLRHRLSGGLQRQTWAGPGPASSAEQAHTAFLPAPAHAHFDGWRTFELIGRRVHFSDEIDWNITTEGPLWAFHLHQYIAPNSSLNTA